MMKFDHVAINVADIAKSVAWYTERVGAKVLYQDDTWGLVEVGGVKLALTILNQHPAHVAFDLGAEPGEDLFRKGKTHRDGSISYYVNDPDGNAVEFIHYPTS